MGKAARLRRSLDLGPNDAALIVRQDMKCECVVAKQQAQEPPLLNSLIIIAIQSRLALEPTFAQECVDWLQNKRSETLAMMAIHRKKEQ